MTTFQLCGIAVCVMVFSIMLKERQGEMALLISCAGSVFLLAAIVPTFAPAVTFITDIIEATALSAYSAVLLKALGVTYVIQITAEICRDAGESSIASKVELAGKGEILLLTLPVIKELIAAANSMI
jgi:Stage III sporulation protein AC/AD protein family.